MAGHPRQNVKDSSTQECYTPEGMARIFDTPFADEDPDLGSPNNKCGGPGVGTGGESDTEGENCDPDGEGNVLIFLESN